MDAPPLISFTCTISSSGISHAALIDKRPILPNPLIPTFTMIDELLVNAKWSKIGFKKDFLFYKTELGLVRF